MYYDGKILFGKSGDEWISIEPSMANRHGLIAGATGTGKTTTLKVLAESFSAAGVPVFFADVKGDLSGIAEYGEQSENVDSRVESMGLAELGFRYERFPVNYWDVYAKDGMPLRTTVSEMGPLLLSRVLGLNETQTDILTVIFKIADDEGMLLIDSKDLKAMVQYVSEKRAEYAFEYGNMAPQSLAAIIRAIVALEADGGEQFIGEPAVDINDWLKCDRDGRGMIQLLDCRELFMHPKMYSTFLLWLMSELFENLPEVGDLERPKMVFFFDEAHLLFDAASKALLEKIEQVVKLIRSKGVGIYFITQAPTDIPDGVLAQLGNKIQHALHAYTPAEQKKLRAAAMSFRENPEFDTYTTLQELGVGKAIVSVLDTEGVPTVTKITKILPPASFMGVIDEDTRRALIEESSLYYKYLESRDRDSAYEFLQRRNLSLTEEKEQAEQEAAAQKEAEKAAQAAAKEKEKAEKEAAKKKAAQEKKVNNAMKSAARSASGTVGREIGQSIGGTFGKFGKKLGGNIGAALGRGLIGTFFNN